MTEAEWMGSTDPQGMLAHLIQMWANTPGYSSNYGSRKRRLFTCACCRSIWPCLTDPRSRLAVETAERYADGLATAAELDDAWLDAWGMDRYTAIDGWLPYQANAAAWTCRKVADVDNCLQWLQDGRLQTLEAQCQILRDLFAPFRRLQFGGYAGILSLYEGIKHKEYVNWLTPTVLELARAAYASGNPMDPGALAVLADALEESGCVDQYLLMHLRGWEWVNIGEHSGTRGPLPTPHYRGCHCLDALLNLE